MIIRKVFFSDYTSPVPGFSRGIGTHEGKYSQGMVAGIGRGDQFSSYELTTIYLRGPFKRCSQQMDLQNQTSFILWEHAQGISLKSVYSLCVNCAWDWYSLWPSIPCQYSPCLCRPSQFHWRGKTEALGIMGRKRITGPQQLRANYEILTPGMRKD